MEQHKLLQKQIHKYLSQDLVEDIRIKEFINSVNSSYVAFERDKELMDHAFKQSEEEYYKINNSLKNEFELKKQSIANLYEGILELESLDDSDDIKDADKNDLLLVSKYINKQISKRMLAEDELLKSYELIKSLLANLQSGIKVEDENRKVIFINQLYCDMFTMPTRPEDVIGEDCSNLVVKYKDLFAEPDLFCDRVDQIVQENKIVLNELIKTVDGKYLERDFIPIQIDGKYKGNLWKYTDVTHKVNINHLLEQGEERNRLIMNSSLNAIVTIDKNGLITFWNDRAERIFGWKREEVFGMKLSNAIFTENSTNENTIEITKFLKGSDELVLNRQFEMVGVNKKGVEFPVEISITPIKQGDNIFYCAFIQDISQRKQAEANLKFQEEKYRNIIANMNLGLIEVDNNDIIKFANQSFSTISGYDVNELLGKNPSELFVFGEALELINTKRVVRKKGISDIYQIPVKNKQGDIRWWAISGAPNFDDKGNLVGTIGIHLDITEQKNLEFELESEKNRAEEASKAKEAFLSNMSHEIRTPLNAIIGFLRELEKQKLTKLQQKYIENSSIASRHLLAIINNILDISKIESGEMPLEVEDFILENTINSVVAILKPKAIEKQISLETHFSEKICPVLKGDALRLNQVLFNLVGNALKFTHKGHIKINCNIVEEDEKSQNICISIEDTGIGMEKEYVNNLFKKFSQEDLAITRKFGGTGLGMAITKELVQLMNGHIEVESEKNKGTTFYIFIKLLKGNIGSAEDLKNISSENNDIDLNGIHLLLVEDNEMNRMVVQNALTHYNCNITEAENGIEAIEYVRNNRYDVILMDIQMPEMDGIEATRMIREDLHITTPIIALTANAFKSEVDKCKRVGMNDYVVKPFEESILVEAVARQAFNKAIIVAKEVNDDTETGMLYDLTSLQAMSRGNDEFIKKMLAIFVDQTKETILLVEDAIKVDDFLEISKLIHKIKPSIQSVGVFSITEDVKYLEKMAKEEPNKIEIRKLFDKIKEILNKVVIQIKTHEL